MTSEAALEEGTGLVAQWEDAIEQTSAPTQAKKKRSSGRAGFCVPQTFALPQRMRWTAGQGRCCRPDDDRYCEGPRQALSDILENMKAQVEALKTSTADSATWRTQLGEFAAAAEEGNSLD